MRRILLVEDEDILRETYSIVLATQPYIVDVAANGQEALDKYHAEQYDLILLDIMMPVMDGLAFLETISSEAGEIPKVIMLTNLSSGTETEQALKLGAEKILLKSDLSPRDLIATVRYEVEAVGL